MKNIELFKVASAQIFLRCYEQFPLPIALSSHDLAVQVNNLTNQKADLTELSIVCTSTVNWLNEEGYIRFGSQDLNHFYEVIATNKLINLFNGMNAAEQKKYSELLASASISLLLSAIDDMLAH